jgi:hypothetical protein
MQAQQAAQVEHCEQSWLPICLPSTRAHPHPQRQSFVTTHTIHNGKRTDLPICLPSTRAPPETAFPFFAFLLTTHTISNSKPSPDLE